MSDSSGEESEHSSEEEEVEEEEEDNSSENDSDEQSSDEKGSEDESSSGSEDESEDENDDDKRSVAETDPDDGTESDSGDEEDTGNKSPSQKVNTAITGDTSKRKEIKDQETQTEPEVATAESQTKDVSGPITVDRDENRREYKDESCETEKAIINDRECQTDEVNYVSRDTLEETHNSLSGRESIQQSSSVPLLSPSRPELKDVEVITDVQIGVLERRILLPQPDQRDATTRTEEIFTSHKEMQTVEIITVSQEYKQPRSTETAEVAVPLKRNEDFLLTMPKERVKTDQGVQADIVLKSRRVGTQTKVRHCHVQTLTSGLIKRVNMQTYTSGLICKSEKSASTVNVKMKDKKTQTKEKYIPGTNTGKTNEEAETLNQNSRKTRVRRSHEMSASKESKAAAPQSVGTEESKPITLNTEEPIEPREKSGDRHKSETALDLEGTPDTKKRKDKENLHKRRRRKREVYFWPIHHPSADSKPKPPKQKRSRTRPKSSGTLPKRKITEGVDSRPLSAAQYRMLYHHRWAEIPF